MVNIFNYTDHKAWLHDAQKEHSAGNRSFSHRNIGRQLDMTSSAAFRQILTGRLKISEKSIPKLAELFGLNKKESEYLRLLVRFNQAKSGEERRERLVDLSSFFRAHAKVVNPHKYDLYDKWHYSAVRALLSYYPFTGDDYETMAKKFDPFITAAEARAAVALLEKLDFISKKRGVYKPTDLAITTGDQAVSTAVSKFQLETLDLAKRSVDHFPRDKRELSTLTLSISQETFDLVKHELAKCRYQVSELARNDKKPDCVYQVNFQVFPLTKV
jgi:uncharacterized protein (TIGR02147 family)